MELALGQASFSSALRLPQPLATRRSGRRRASASRRGCLSVVVADKLPHSIKPSCVISASCSRSCSSSASSRSARDRPGRSSPCASRSTARPSTSPVRWNVSAARATASRCRPPRAPTASCVASRSGRSSPARSRAGSSSPSPTTRTSSSNGWSSCLISACRARRSSGRISAQSASRPSRRARAFRPRPRIARMPTSSA